MALEVEGTLYDGTTDQPDQSAVVLDGDGDEKSVELREPRFFNATIFNELCRLILRMEVDAQSLENLKQLNRLVEAGYSSIVFSNHPGVKEIVALPALFLSYIESAKSIGGPAAISHYRGLEGVILRQFTKIMGLSDFPVIRSKDLNRHPNRYSRKQQKQLLAELFAGTEQMLSDSGLYFLTPFAERVKNDAASGHSVNPSFVKLSRDNPDALLTPVGVVTKNGRFQVKVGKSMTFESAQVQTAAALGLDISEVTDSEIARYLMDLVMDSID